MNAASDPPPNVRSWPARIAILALAVLVSAHFSLTLMHAATPFLDTGQWLDLAADRPFQYRLLMVPVMRGLIDTIGAAAPGFVASLPPFVGTPELLAYAALNAAACFVALGSFWCLLNRLYAPGDPAQAIAASLFLALLYLFFCLNPNLAFILPYDIPAIAFTTASLCLWRTGKWLILVPFFALATLNRETIVLVPVAIAIHAFSTGGDRRELALAAVLLALWIAVKFWLAWQFSHLPSEEGLRLGYNFATLAKPWQWPAIFILPLLAGFTIKAALRKDEGLVFALTALAGGAMLFAVANITEIRAFGELIPYLALALAPLLRDKLIPTAPTSR